MGVGMGGTGGVGEAGNFMAHVPVLRNDAKGKGQHTNSIRFLKLMYGKRSNNESMDYLFQISPQFSSRLWKKGI